MSRYFNSIRFIDQQMKFTKEKILLFGGAANESIARGLEYMEDDYSGPTTDTLTKKMRYYSDIMPHKVALDMHVTLPLVHKLGSWW